MKILFFGTDFYSTLALPHLIDNPNNHIVGVVTNNKKPSLPFSYESVFEFSQSNKLLTILVDSKATLLEQQNSIAKLKPDIGLVVSFGYLIPQSIYTLPRHGTLNIHPSLLPEYRGVSPMQQAIIDGKATTGVTIMRINESFDTGPILSQVNIAVDRTDNTHTLATKAIPTGVALFNELTKNYPNGEFPETPQPETQLLYTRTIDKTDAYIDFSHNVELIDRKIRAYYPKPLAWTYLDKIAKFFSPHSPIAKNWDQKRVLLYESSVQGSSLIIEKLQIEGKEPITWEQFKSGYIQG